MVAALRRTAAKSARCRSLPRCLPVIPADCAVPSPGGLDPGVLLSWKRHVFLECGMLYHQFELSGHFAVFFGDSIMFLVVAATLSVIWTGASGAGDAVEHRFWQKKGACLLETIHVVFKHIRTCRHSGSWASSCFLNSDYHYDYIVITYLPHKALAEVSKDKEPIGRGCAEFNWFENELMSDSSEVRFK